MTTILSILGVIFLIFIVQFFAHRAKSNALAFERLPPYTQMLITEKRIDDLATILCQYKKENNVAAWNDTLMAVDAQGVVFASQVDKAVRSRMC